MILASAQTKPSRFNIEKNLNDHYDMIELAFDKGANLIVFPEMSITGYERDKASDLAFSPTDSRLDTLRELSADKKMIIVAGAPIQTKTNMYIGSFVLFPDKSVSIYTKQFLHTGEDEYFQSTFEFNPLIELQGERISLAICADIDHPQHAENASKVNSTLYIPSIFFSPGGLQEAYDNLSNYAKMYSMSVLMSNFCKEAWNRPSGGKSALWNSKGELIGNLNDSDAGLLIAEKTGDSWKTSCIYM